MADKEYEEDDPLSLVGVRLSGPEAEEALDEMARTFVDEFLRMGYSAERIRRIFTDPFFRGPYEVYRRRGAAFVERLLEEVG